MSRELIIAIDSNGAIGADGGLGFSLPHDMEWFKWYTMGKVVAAGRKTAESFHFNLPGCASDPSLSRELKVISSDRLSVDEALMLPNVCFIGGGQVYKQVLPYVDRMVVTHLGQPLKKADTHVALPTYVFRKATTVKEWKGNKIVIYDR